MWSPWVFDIINGKFILTSVITACCHHIISGYRHFMAHGVRRSSHISGVFWGVQRKYSHPPIIGLVKNVQVSIDCCHPTDYIECCSRGTGYLFDQFRMCRISEVIDSNPALRPAVPAGINIRLMGCDIGNYPMQRLLAGMSGDARFGRGGVGPTRLK